MSTRAPYSEEIIDGTQFGPACYGWYHNTTTAYTDNPAVLADHGTKQYNGSCVGFSEDCLNVNIWAPVNAKNAPVMIWIHGGSFYTNSNSVKYQQGWALAQEQRIILVALNYRLHIFGYPPAKGIDATKRNVGLFDQRMAVEWTRDNIAAFGGDPDNMVLWGESAGSIAVDHYAYGWVDDPIVKGLISNSGSVFSVPDNSKDESWGNFTTISTEAGCNISDPAVELQCMKNLDARVLNNLVEAHQDLTFNIIVDDVTVYDSYKNRSIANIPYLMGSNDNEGVTFVSFARDGINQTAANIFMYKYLTCAMMEAANARLERGIPVFRYHYYGNFSSISPLHWMGAFHGSEVPMVFGTYHKINSTAEQVAASQYLRGGWTAFAKSQASGVLNYGWKQYNASAATLNQLALNDNAVVQFSEPVGYDYICSTYPAVNLS